MRHPTYKHLDAKLRLGSFSLGQWAQITVAGVVAALFGGYVSPLPTQATIFVSILLPGCRSRCPTARWAWSSPSASSRARGLALLARAAALSPRPG